MKPTESFKKVIEAKLQEMGAADPLFAANLKKEGKNIDDCITYILNSVQKSGCNGFADDEIYGMAAHYYDEDNIDIGNPISCNVVVNHSVELTPEEIAQAKQAAIDKLIGYEMQRVSKKPAPKKEEQNTVIQPSLFD